MFGLSHSVQVKLHILMVAILLAGALNVGLSGFGFNLIEKMGQSFYKTFGFKHFDVLLSLIVLGAGAIFAMDPNNWIAFLGEAAFPGSLIPIKDRSNESVKFKLVATPNTKIAYWSTNNTDSNMTPDQAYGDFSNSGVTMTNDKGEADLYFSPGSGYKVGIINRLVPRHFHYREIGNGIMSEVKTVYITY